MGKLKEEDLIGKVGVVSVDTSHNVYFKISGEEYDNTGFMNWVNIWKGRLFNYTALLNDLSIVDGYKTLLCSGHPGGLVEMIALSKRLKGKLVVMFTPEGDVCQYDMYGINSLNRVVYDCWNSVDVVTPQEEDKISYYKSLTNTPVKFIHVPIDERMSSGEFRRNVETKSKHILVYGDNNPNCPVTVMGVVRRLNKPLKTVCIDEDKVKQLREVFGVCIDESHGKLSQYAFLRLLGSTYLHIYPTRWIGSAREPIACAIVGTPCIGSDKSHTQRRLFPELACDIYDVDRMVELANRLYTDLDFYKRVVDYSWEKLPFYDLEHAKKRFVEAVETGMGSII